MVYRYHFLLRPPTYGACPGVPLRTHATLLDDDTLTGGEVRPTHGWADYATALTNNDIWRFDLLPDNPTERALYLMWLACDRDYEEAAAMILDYRQLPPDQLIAQAERGNPYAVHTLAYLRATGQAA